MKQKFDHIFGGRLFEKDFFLVMILFLVPMSVFASPDDSKTTNSPGSVTLLDNHQKAQTRQDFKNKTAIFTQDFYLADTSMGLITSSSSIGGYGTISCFDGGLKVMVCDVGFYLTNGGLVKGVNATVTTFTAGGVQAGTESIDQWFDIGPLYKKYEDQIEEPLYVAGEYNARVTGAIAYMGKTGEGILNILPIKSAEVTIE